ncbi:MAG TPA: sulfotransferase [Candidatus Acidoferrales bacterium]|nr:sulfotransferase [Candidatus Acidoferrales bacterium]
MPAPSPNFLFIGPDKSGSTWLYEALKQHPQVFLPSVKELFFFDRFYDKGWPWYRNYFRGAGDQHRIVAEICHDYLASPLACRRIAHDLPTVKLMICLREPVERAFSAYLYMVKVGEVACDFETALGEVEELVDRGLYAKYMGYYLEHFRRDQIYVGVFDDLVTDPQRFFGRVCEFLGIRPMSLSSELKQRVLPAAKSRLPRATKFARDLSWRLRQWGFPGVVGKIKESPLLAKILYHPYAPNEKPQVSPAIRSYLRQIFIPEVQRLDALLSSHLSLRWGYTEEKQSHSRSLASVSGR